MKTDRELLELAAKAHGKVNFDRSVLASVMLEFRNDDMFHWDPLNDDGDALRLANKLGLTVQIDLVDDLTRIMDDCEEVICIHLHSSDGVDAATRRAITRAAAQIGTDSKQNELSREA